jgi:hypothetical protein
MTKSKFNKLFKGVNGPECRGAPLPLFNPYAINEGMFDDELRFKEYDLYFDKDVIKLNWITQGCFYNNSDCIYGFLKEVSRCIHETIGYKNKINVMIKSRDGEEYGFYITELRAPLIKEGI